MKHNVIHTLPALRSEIKSYKCLIVERNQIIENYQSPLDDLKGDLENTIIKLNSVKSPSSNLTSGYSSDKGEKYTYLIEKRDKLEFEIDNYIINHADDLMKSLEPYDTRIATIEYYLSKIEKEEERNFINDLYIKPISFKKIMKKYKIKDNSNVYRKATKILKKCLNDTVYD